MDTINGSTQMQRCAAWLEGEPDDDGVDPEPLVQPQWKELPEQPAGDQDRSSGPGTAPAVDSRAEEFGAGVFDDS